MGAGVGAGAATGVGAGAAVGVAFLKDGTNSVESGLKDVEAPGTKLCTFVENVVGAMVWLGTTKFVGLKAFGCAMAH